MARAICDDFRSIDGTEVCAMRDNRLANFSLPGCDLRDVNSAVSEQRVFQELACRANYTLIIAPEFDGILLDRCLLAESLNVRLLSPSSDFIRVAADKCETAARLWANKVPAPSGQAFNAMTLSRVRFPAIIKPRFGAGSDGVQFVESIEQARCASDAELPLRIEEFCNGTPASVSILCGKDRKFALRPCLQRVSSDGSFQYLGGELPLPPNLAERARRLATAAVQALPQTTGFVGVDVVLGDQIDGSGDRVIEINPRLTTSYVGLRAASNANLAQAMLNLALGNDPQLSFSSAPVKFNSSGEIEQRR